jgi:hypothetical protein
VPTQQPKDDSIRLEFATFPLTAEALEKCDQVRRAYSALLTEIEEYLDLGRERALVITHLQTAKDWTIRGIALQPGNQVRSAAK